MDVIDNNVLTEPIILDLSCVWYELATDNVFPRFALPQSFFERFFEDNRLLRGARLIDDLNEP